MKLKCAGLMAAAVAACGQMPRETSTPSAPVARSTASVPQTDTTAAIRDSLMNVVLRRIAGRESSPAESVFRNIRVLRGVPAGRLPRIMNLGYGRSLGVTCSHCHAGNNFASESNPKKQVAREMIGMTETINRDLLSTIPNLSERPTVNCTTCHRGTTTPAVNMPVPGSGGG